MDQIMIQTLHGLVNGMVLAMVASGLTLIFGIMDIVNFAHGDLLMLGAFVGASVVGVTGNYWLALVVAAIVIAMLGALLQITTLRPLIGRDPLRSEEHTSELQSLAYLVCRLLLEKKKKYTCIHSMWS